MRFQKLLLSVIPILLVGFFLFALPDKGFAQGCCENPGASPTCVPGQSFPQGNQQSCEQSMAGRNWLPNDVCQGDGQPQCVPAVGCCIEAPGMCVDDQEEGQCNGEWVFDTACDTIEECEPVTGCCVDDSGPTCTFEPDNPDCDTFMANVPCDGNACSGEGPTGCCSGIPPNGFMACEDSFTESECASESGNFSEGEQCNSVDTCGQVGCCQEDGPMCSLTNMEDCSGTWVPDDTCTDSGICASLITGCCVFHKNDCEFISEQDCVDEGGKFTDEGVECSEVPICNVVVSPIPTLNQWGLIAMAGLLGLFSLFIIIRRHRYNLS